MPTAHSTGVYTLANDSVLEWTIAFLESLRHYEPNRRLIIIPFDANTSALAKLAARYNFEILQDDQLEQLDALGSMFWPDPRGAHLFRKLAAFWGPLEQFLYLDSDIVMLGALDELFESFASSPCDLMYADLDPRQVYRTAEFRALMTACYGSKGFNSGVLLSAKGVFTLDELERLGHQAALHREHFASTGEQPFLNYCVDVKRLRTRRLQEVVPELAATWANQPGIYRHGDGWRVRDPRGEGPPKRLALIHWAGFPLQRPIPHFEIFRHYRLLSEQSAWRRFGYPLRWRVRQFIGAVGQWLRDARRGSLPQRAPAAAAPFGALGVEPASRYWGFDRGLPIDRYYIERFLARHAGDIRGQVLEVGDDSYTRRFGGDAIAGCDVLNVAPGDPRTTIVAALSDAEQIPSDRFDCIILTQTLQLIYEVPAAIRTLFRILKPGGVLLVTVPGISRISQEEWAGSWFWRFTSFSARRLFQEVFPAASVEVESHGNVLAASAFLYGFAVEDLKQGDLDPRDPDFEVTITIRAVRPSSGV